MVALPHAVVEQTPAAWYRHRAESVDGTTSSVERYGARPATGQSVEADTFTVRLLIAGSRAVEDVLVDRRRKNMPLSGDQRSR